MKWSPTGKAHGTLVNAPVGRHPGQTLAHLSTAKGRACTPECLPAAGRCYGTQAWPFAAGVNFSWRW